MRRVPLSLLRAVLTVALVSPVGALSAESTKLPPAITRSVDFERDVQPIFAQSCLECHGPKKQKSDFRIDVKKISLAGGVSGKPAIVPGKSADSPLIRFVAGLEDDMQMPPSGKGDPLTAEQVADFETWIKMGAPDPRAGVVKKAVIDTLLEKGKTHWAFQVPQAAPTPPGQHLVDALLPAKGATAEPRVLIRRASLALTGLPPSPERVEALARRLPRPDCSPASERS